MKDAQSRRERREQLLASITPEEAARLAPRPVQQLTHAPCEVVEEIRTACREACGENPDLHEDDVMWEVANSYLFNAANKREILAQLGF